MTRDDAASVALAGCTMVRAHDGMVEIVEAGAAHRAFPARINESLGVCWKSGRDHDVVAEGRTLRFPEGAICVRPPGCVWGTEGTGDVGFLSIDVHQSLVPRGARLRTMSFIASAALPQFRAFAKRLGRGTRAPDLVTELLLALHATGVLPADELDQDAAPRLALEVRDALDVTLRDPPSIAELADALGTNRFALTRAFKQRFGVAPHAYLVGLRIERARVLLARGREPTRVALDLGFADQAHLTRLFKRVVGIPPGQYAKQARAQTFKPAPG